MARANATYVSGSVLKHVLSFVIFYVKVSKSQKYVPGVCEKDICARSKNAIIRKSLSGEAHKQILQKSARDSHHRMICGSGVIWATQNVLLVNEISTSTILCIFMTSEYVTFTMVTATRSICDTKNAEVLYCFLFKSCCRLRI